MSRKLTSAALLAAASLAAAAGVMVDPSAKQQQIVGFGGGSVYYQGWIAAMGDEAREALFDTAYTGLNLSLLRVGNWLQDESKGVSEDDIMIVQAGKKRLGDHLKIEMSSWSVPGSLKGSGSVNGSDGTTSLDNTLKKGADGKYVYGDFAAWWKRSIQAYNAAGITPDYISIQNEPDMNASYEETLFDPTETDTLAGYSEALNAVYAELSTLPNRPKILGPEPLGIGYNNFQKYAKALDASKLDGYAYHIYHAGNGNDNSGNNYLKPENFRSAMKSIGTSYGTKPIIMTEFCNMLDKTREEDMVGLAHIMQVGFSDGKLAGYIAWELFWGDKIGQLLGVCAKGWGNCKEDGFFVNPEYHAMRHYSKFVNPGWSVVTSAADDAALKSVAFTSPAGDSISVVVINTGDKAISLDNPAIAGYGVVTAVQSKENGFKSKPVTIATCTMLPARSVTTLVYKKGAAAATATACQDETTDPNYVEPVVVPTADIVIADFTTGGNAADWRKSKTTLQDVTYETAALDGVAAYMKVPTANCKQGDSDDCPWQSQLFDISAEASKALGSCQELVFTMRSIDDSKAAYINIGGANGGSWVDYKYGNAASAGKWAETKVPLDNEGDNESTSLTFNSNNEGFLLAKIVATGCTSSDAIKPIHFTMDDSHMVAQVFDLNGNLVWTGLKGQALNANGTIRLDVRQGAYIVKTRAGAIKAIKK